MECKHKLHWDTPPPPKGHKFTMHKTNENIKYTLVLGKCHREMAWLALFCGFGKWASISSLSCIFPDIRRSPLLSCIRPQETHTAASPSSPFLQKKEKTTTTNAYGNKNSSRFSCSVMEQMKIQVHISWVGQSTTKIGDISFKFWRGSKFEWSKFWVKQIYSRWQHPSRLQVRVHVQSFTK